MTSRNALLTLLALGISLSFIALITTVGSYSRLRGVAEVLPSLIPVHEPTVQRALEAANLTEQQQWISRSMKSQFKETESAYKLAQGFIESWSKAMLLQSVFWLGALAVLGAACVRASRWQEPQPSAQADGPAGGGPAA